MKMPIDPSEPLFPVRPDEPLCQYYMKHGTCKFGQTCKFHHPPQSELPDLIANSSIGNGVAAVAAKKTEQAWNGEQQVLPQRPEEPNCIFFLKNGRCKYGATCRYHHPLNYHREDSRSRKQEGGPRIHYVTQLPPGSYQQGHFVVADGTVAFLSLDGSSTAQIIPVSSQVNDHLVYGNSRPLGHSRDVAASSSSPSIASSYETAMSNMDHHGGDSSSSSLWNNNRRNNSSNSLGAFNTLDGSGRHHVVQGGGRTVYIQDPSNMHRVASISSNASEGGSVYFDAPQGMGRSASSQQVASTGLPAWRERRSNSFDQGGSLSSSGYREEEYYDGQLQRRSHHHDGQPSPRGRPPTGARRRNMQGGEVDDGLSMMTSALLTMLDTPEESNYEAYYDEHSGHSSQMSTPQMRPVDFKDRGSPQGAAQEASGLYHPEGYQNGYFDHSTGSDDRVLGLVMHGESSRRPLHLNYDDPVDQRKELGHGGSLPPWQGHNTRRPLQENAHSLSVSQTGSGSPHNPSNVGLYLP